MSFVKTWWLAMLLVATGEPTAIAAAFLEDPSSNSASREPSGTLFPVPVEITDHCNDRALKAKYWCKTFYEHLSQMPAEPRDPTWASRMEQKILAYYEHAYSDGSIRNLECRSTWCAIDIKAVDDHHLSTGIFWPVTDPLNRQLNKELGETDSECGIDDAYGKKVCVVIWKRRT